MILKIRGNTLTQELDATAPYGVRNTLVTNDGEITGYIDIRLRRGESSSDLIIVTDKVETISLPIRRSNGRPNLRFKGKTFPPEQTHAMVSRSVDFTISHLSPEELRLYEQYMNEYVDKIEPYLEN